MILTEAMRAAHSQLSRESLLFVEHALREPECMRRPDQKLEQWNLEYAFKVQPWPTFVGAQKLEQIRRATIGLTGLVRQIPARVFGGDPRTISDFYGLDSEPFAALILDPPNGIDGSVGRHDFIDGPSGFQCLELNFGSYIGGWQIRYWERLWRRNQMIARFLAEQGIEPRYQDPFRAFFSHVAEDTRRQVELPDKKLNVALVTPDYAPVPREAIEHLSDLHRETLREVDDSLEGEVVAATYPQGFSVRQGKLFTGGLMVHAIIEYTEVPTPSDVFRCFKRGTVSLYNGPASQLLGNKRNFVLLSQLEDSAALSDDERSLIKAHVPWSRDMVRGETRFKGETIDLPDALIARRGEFIIKLVDGSKGEGVHVGKFMAQDEWNDRVSAAMQGGGWLAQEYVSSHPYLYQCGDYGALPHDVVWGIFCFGDDYGGGFLRMKPRDTGSGVINSAQGATEGFLYEV